MAADTDAAQVAVGRGDDAMSLRVELTYDAPSGCGDERQVLRRTQQLLGVTKPYGLVKAAIVVRQLDAGMKLDYEATSEGAQSKRDLVVTDCAAAVEASALLLMLTLDPVAAARAAEQRVDAIVEVKAEAGPSRSAAAAEGPSPPPTEPRSSTEPGSSTEPRSSAKPRSTPSPVESQPALADPPDAASAFEVGDTWVGLAGELVTALTPNPARGLRLDAGTTVAGVRFGIWASYDWVSARSLSQASFATLESRLVRLRLWGGPCFRAGAVRFGPVLALGTEHLRAEVVGISDPVPGAMTWLSGTVGGHFDVHLTQSLALRAQTSAVFSLERRSFTVRGIPGLVHQPQTVGVEAAAGVVWVWGAR